MLQVEGLSAHYGHVQAVREISLTVKPEEVLAIIGANGAGKTSMLKAIMGALRPTSGRITFRGERIDGLPTYDVVSRGLVLVPEGRKVFPSLTVEQNLKMGAYLRYGRDRRGVAEDLESVRELFPRLRERWRQMGGTLSGGEQQMLAIARGLMSRPHLMMLDEPSLGLAPMFVESVFDIIDRINGRGTTVLIVEQNVRVALALADRGYVMETGQIVLADTAANLTSNPQVQRAYLGEKAAGDDGQGSAVTSQSLG